MISVPFLLTHNQERKEVLQPGFGVEQKDTMIYYIKTTKESRTLGVLQCFELKTLYLILAMLFGFVFVLFISKPCSNINIWQFLISMLVVGKAVLGQGVDTQSMGTVFKRTRTIQVFFLSAFGALIFWSYTGILTSLIAIQQEQVPLRSFEELKFKGKYALISMNQGSTYGSIFEWANKSTETLDLFHKFIQPFGIEAENMQFLTDDLKRLMKTHEIGILLEEESFRTWVRDEALACQFAGIPFKSIPRTTAGWMFPKNSMLQPLFDKFMKELDETGVLDQIFKHHTMKRPECPQAEFSGISIEFSLILFIILAVGVIMSLGLFVLELFGVPIMDFNRIWP